MFYGGIGLVLLVWSTVASIRNGSGLLHFFLATVSFVLVAVSALPVFVLPRFLPNNERFIFWIPYLIWGLVVPFVWLATFMLMKQGFAYFVLACCPENPTLNNVFWPELSDLASHSLTPICIMGLLLAIPLVQMQAIRESQLLKIFNKIFAGLFSTAWIIFLVFGFVKIF